MPELVTYRTKSCLVCGKSSLMEVWDEDLQRYLNGAHIQHAFPTLKPAVREMIASGTHPECWIEMFGDDKYDE